MPDPPMMPRTALVMPTTPSLRRNVSARRLECYRIFGQDLEQIDAVIIRQRVVRTCATFQLSSPANDQGNDPVANAGGVMVRDGANAPSHHEDLMRGKTKPRASRRGQSPSTASALSCRTVRAAASARRYGSRV